MKIASCLENISHIVRRQTIHGVFWHKLMHKYNAPQTL